MLGEYDAGYENYIDSLIREIEKLQDENDKLREQVSSLVDRSFRTADKMSCIEAENAKLRKSLEYANNEWEKESMEYLSTQDQNVKLRELVKSMYYDLTHMTFPPDWVTDYEADMRELGIEVTE